jgi:hypothetical protein
VFSTIDLSTLQLVEVPNFAPPYDCEIHGAVCPAFDAPADVPDPEGAWVAVASQASGVSGIAESWPGQFAQVMTEIVAGMRSVRQVAPWATDRVTAQIRGLIPAFTTGRRPRIQRIVTSRPAASALEMTVIVAFGPRTHAFAMRFDQIPARPGAPGLPPRPARWLCTALETA